MGRIDQMLIVRGVNIFLSSIEAIVRAFPAVQEFAVVLKRAASMDAIEIQVEIAAGDPQGILDAIRQEPSHRLGLRVEASLARPGSVPRFELKASRVTDQRNLREFESSSLRG